MIILTPTTLAVSKQNKFNSLLSSHFLIHFCWCWPVMPPGGFLTLALLKFQTLCHFLKNINNILGHHHTHHKKNQLIFNQTCNQMFSDKDYCTWNKKMSRLRFFSRNTLTKTTKLLKRTLLNGILYFIHGIIHPRRLGLKT